MINEQNTLQVQQISDAYVKLVEREVGVDMVCTWGMIDKGGELLGSGFSMSKPMKHEDLTNIIFYMQRNLFLNLIQQDGGEIQSITT